MKRTLTRAAVAILTASGLMLLLTGCLKVDADFSIEENQTVTGTMLLAMDASVAQALGMDPADAFTDQDDTFDDVDGVTVTPYDDGTWVGTEYTFQQVSLDDFNSDPSDPEGMRITYDAEAGTYEFWAVADFMFEEEFEEDPDEPDLIGLDLPEFEALWATFDVTITVTFPGEVIEHNGELSGTTVTWSPQAGERTELYAVARASGGGLNPASVIGKSGSSLWWILAAVGFLVVLGVVVLVIVLALRKRRTAPVAPVPMGVLPQQPVPPTDMPPQQAPPTPPGH
ncbi:MAG TPA: hypothetical protein VKZ67_12865 [Natronosporangium sp.]|nr:hypothetical protein [Natronosporangium sp.]